MVNESSINVRFKSVLFAPGNRSNVLSKIPRSQTDAAVIDLEDATPQDHKENARETARATSIDLAREHKNLGLFIRVNALHTPYFFDDLKISVSDVLTGVIVPKLSTKEDIESAASALKETGHKDLPIMAGLETVLGLRNALEIAEHPKVKWIYFGAEDYVADLGGIRRADNLEVLFARSQVGQISRIAEVSAFDMVVTDFSDEQRFQRECEEARALGFTGKLCIHPSQVSLANKMFQPTTMELEWAKKVVNEYREALKRGEASISLNNEMIDEAVFKRALAILESPQS